MMLSDRWLYIKYLILIITDICFANGSCSFHFDSRQSKVGNFSSPRFPDNYPSGADCRYTFEGEDHEGIKLAFFVFDLEPPFKAGCLMDYVDISTINMFSMKHKVGRFCGDNAPAPFLSMYPKVELIFRSSEAREHKGFYGTYHFVDEKYVPAPTSTIDVEGCGGSLSGDGGIITSPGYPSHFPGKIDCLWLIRVPYTKNIYIRILDMQLHGSIANCNRASVRVYDGYTSFAHNPRVVKTYCGDLKYYKNVDDRNALSHRNRLIIRFTADEPKQINEIGGTVGFKLVWTEVAFVEQSHCSQFACKSSEYCLESRPGVSCNPTKLFCIHQSMECNGVPNCSEGDNSDEDQCSQSYLVMACAVASLVGLSLLVLLVVLCVCRHHVNLRKSTSQTQALTLQLRQLDHSPSCSNRQLSASFSQPCDLLSPAVLEVNGTPKHAHTRFFVVNNAAGGQDAVTTYSRYKGDPTEV